MKSLTTKEMGMFDITYSRAYYLVKQAKTRPLLFNKLGTQGE